MMTPKLKVKDTCTKHMELVFHVSLQDCTGMAKITCFYYIYGWGIFSELKHSNTKSDQFQSPWLLKVQNARQRKVKLRDIWLHA